PVFTKALPTTEGRWTKRSLDLETLELLANASSDRERIDLLREKVGKESGLRVYVSSKTPTEDQMKQLPSTSWPSFEHDPKLPKFTARILDPKTTPSALKINPAVATANLSTDSEANKFYGAYLDENPYAKGAFVPPSVTDLGRLHQTKPMILLKP